MNRGERIVETVTLAEARCLLEATAEHQSVLLLSPPGVGKSEMVCQSAEDAGLECRSLLGTQIAPEDVSGVPRIVGERSVFCPPRVLLPEQAQPFCLFLDELPACTPDIQKAFYSLLLERRLGEHHLPAGTWVVAAGNRVQDRALVRTMSSALLNRVIVMQIRTDVDEWLKWANRRRLRVEVTSFIRDVPEALLRAIPQGSEPFSTPRSWAALADALDCVEQEDALDETTLRALVAGRVSACDVDPFCNWFWASQHAEEDILHTGWKALGQTRVQDLSLSHRAAAALMSHGIYHVEELLLYTPQQLNSLADFDRTRVDEVAAALAVKGLRLAPAATGTRPPEVTLSQAKSLVRALADRQSVLLVSAPGVGKSEIVRQVAKESGLTCKSLLGTQLAPEDVSGIPRIVGERSVFCPPRVLLPEEPEPFCLFLDELPASSPEVQKSFYSLLLERRVGEHRLPEGTWVVAAGNRATDRSLVRSLSSALLNRVLVLQVRVDAHEWIRWALQHRIRSEIVSFITYMPDALMRGVPAEPVPFSTPRAWVSLSRSLDLVERRGVLNERTRRALAFGTVSAEDAAVFCAMAEDSLSKLCPLEAYLEQPEKLPQDSSARWFIIHRLRTLVQSSEFPATSPEQVNRFLAAIPTEFRFAVLIDLVDEWARLGAADVMLETLCEVTGLSAAPAESGGRSSG